MNKLIKAVGLVCVLGACVGGYIYLQKQTQTETEGTSEISGRFDLTDRETENLVGLSWTDGTSQSSFTKKEGTWVNDQKDYPVNQEKLEGLGDTLTSLQATRQLENVTSPEDYGIKTESYQLVATWDDGSTTTYVMGDETPFGDGYYLSLDAPAQTAVDAAGEDQKETAKSSGIYTIENSLATTFTFNDEDFVQKIQLPDRSAVTRISLGDQLDLSYQSGGGTYEPDQHYIDTATGLGMDEENAKKLFDSIQNLTLGTLSSVNAAQEELASYGLTDEGGFPVKVYQGDELILDLLLGKAPQEEAQVAEETVEADAITGEVQDDSETYVRLADSYQIYTIDSATYSDLTSASMETLFDRDLVGLPYELVDQAEFTIAGTKYVLEGKGQEAAAQTAEEGESATEAVETATEGVSEAATEGVSEAVTETGQEATQGDEQALAPVTDSTGVWDQLTSLRATALAQTPGGEEILSLTITRTDGTVSSLVVQAMDVDSYLVQVDEEPAKLVNASDVDTLVRLVKAKLA